MSEIIKILEQKISAKRDLIADFFAKKFAESPQLFYNSVDLRHSGFKIAPVDTNCFPAGFNNLSDISEKLAEKIADDFFNKNFSAAKKILILPENHTRNLSYLKNVANLQKILGTKREVIVGTLIPELKEKTALDLENGDLLTIHPLVKKSDKIETIDGFLPDVILLNNDLTDGVPEILQNLSTPVIPSPNMGWHRRTKSNHFTIYNKLAEELTQILEIDPWLISSMHSACDNVNFKEREGIERLAKNVDELLQNLQKKYQENGIDEKPYCYIKADNGTYGLAVWPVFSAEEVLEINKKERNKMNAIKGAVQTTHVIIQEGIKTIDKIDEKIAEPMIYMINATVVGNLFRVNEARDEKISLNAAGASFLILKIFKKLK